MQEEWSVFERRIDALQCAKKEMACRVAELNELTVVRGELEHRLFDLNATIKQLKARQYELHQQNVNGQCEGLQGRRTMEECKEEIGLGKAVSHEIEMDLARQKDNISQLQRENQKLIGRKGYLDGQIRDRTTQIELSKKKIDEVEESIKSLKKVQHSRQEIIEKIKQSYQYYLSKAEQLQKSKQNIRKLSSGEEKKGEELQKAIKQSDLQMQAILNKKVDNQREIINQLNAIDSQKLRQKVLLEKQQIMKEKLGTLQEQERYGHQLLQLRQRSAKSAQQTRNKRRSAWLSMRHKIGVELEYCRHYCQQHNG